MSCFREGRFGINERHCVVSRESEVSPPGAPTTYSKIDFTVYTGENIIDELKGECQEATMVNSYAHD